MLFLKQTSKKKYGEIKSDFSFNTSPDLIHHFELEKKFVVRLIPGL